MLLLVPEYIVRAAWRSSHAPSGPDIVNTLHFVAAQLSSPADPDTWASDIDTRFRTSYKGLLTDSTKLHELTTTCVDGFGDIGVQGSVVIEQYGTRSEASAPLAEALCQVLSLKTATHKRYARGRMFLPPALVSGAIDAGGIWKASDAYWTNATTFANLLAGWTHGDITYAPVVYSRRRKQLELSPAWFPITGYQQRSEQHWLRSRMTTP